MARYTLRQTMLLNGACSIQATLRRFDMNILKAIQTLKDKQSVTVKHGLLSRHDVGGKAYYTMTYPCGSKKEDWILVRMLKHPAYVLELI